MINKRNNSAELPDNLPDVSSVEEITEMSKRLPIIKDEIDKKSMRWLELSELD